MAENIEEKKTTKRSSTKTTKTAEPKEAKTTKTTKTAEAKETKTTKTAESKTTKTATKTTTKTATKSTTKTATKTAKAKTAKVKAQEFLGTGRRKCSVARVRVTTGTGKILVNNQELKDYFDLDTLIALVKQPLVLTETENNVDVVANIYGGGKAGQAGALRHGITRALIEFRPELRSDLKKAGLVSRDARKKERKKYGLKKARRAPQFSKR